MDGHVEYRKKFLTNLKGEMNRNQLNLNLNTLADIIYYKSIEKRGFLARLKGVEMNWQDLQKYALRRMIERNTPVWLRIPKPKLTERLKMWGGSST